MTKATTKETKPKRKTKLERTTEAQLFLEQDELQKQLEAEEHATEASEGAPAGVESALACAESKPAEVHEQRIVRRLRKL